MRRPIFYVILGVAISLVALGIYIPTLGPQLKRRVISALQERFNADVQLQKLSVSLYPVPSVDGEGLVVNQIGKPLISIRHFHARAGLTTIFDLGQGVDEVVLDGLEVQIPHRSDSEKPPLRGKDGKGRTQLRFVIQKIIANNAMLVIEPKPGKDGLVFPIQRVVMTSVGPGQAMAFQARLTNAKPPGAIDSDGHFGPWKTDDPRSTPVSGKYTFEHADLAVFNGISGLLSSQGSYQGVLEKIVVDGTTDTPQFALKKGGAAVHLTTKFHSIVDGTNGDTVLYPVDAKFGQSEFICSGGIVRKPGEKGKTVELQAHTKYARMEDILTLVVAGQPILKGDVDFQSKIVIPPGKEQVADKLGLDGQFHLKSATFTDPKISDRLRILSERASGITKHDEEQGAGDELKVASNMVARFKVDKGVASFFPVAFEVPGSKTQLSGDFNLVSSAVDMKGTFQMNAKLSQTQSGFKAVLLKPFDRLFEKNGVGFEIPISITGTREHPTIGVEMFHHTFSIH